MNERSRRFRLAIFIFSRCRFIHSSGGFRREVQPRRQHWFLNEKSGFPFRTPAFCSVSRGRRRLGEKEYRAPSVTPGVALRPRTQANTCVINGQSSDKCRQTRASGLDLLRNWAHR